MSRKVIMKTCYIPKEEYDRIMQSENGGDFRRVEEPECRADGEAALCSEPVPDVDFGSERPSSGEFRANAVSGTDWGTLSATTDLASALGK